MGRPEENGFANPADFRIVRADIVDNFVNDDQTTCVFEDRSYSLYNRGEDALKHVLLLIVVCV